MRPLVEVAACPTGSPGTAIGAIPMVTVWVSVPPLPSSTVMLSVSACVAGSSPANDAFHRAAAVGVKVYVPSPLRVKVPLSVVKVFAVLVFPLTV